MATTAKKKVAKAGADEIVGYCMKTKQNETMQDVQIKVSSGKYIALGTDAAGNKISKIMSKADAEGHVEAGRATWLEEEAPAKKKVAKKATK